MKQIIDCKGLKCPQPVINTKKYFDTITAGEAEVIVDNEVAKNNILKFAGSNGFQSSVERKDEYYHITVIKAEGKCEIMDFTKGNTVILVTSNEFGVGDPKLGNMLMKSYLYALTESKTVPSDLIFINSGVNLVVENSEVIDSIKALEAKGTSISSCGTCLDFYGIKEKLAIGEITNMYAIVEKMNSAANTIKI